MLRKLLLLVALLLVIVIALVALRVIRVDRGSDGSVSIRTQDVEVGTTTTNVQLPVVRMEERTVEVPSVGVDQEEGQVNAQ